ncbi:unnamed protein product, partial [Prorocentrum cordatum]
FLSASSSSAPVHVPLRASAFIRGRLWLRARGQQPFRYTTALAIFSSCPRPPAEMTQVFFKAKCYTEMGQRVVLTGNDPTLGSWDPTKSKVELTTDAAHYPYWTGALSAPVGTDILFKMAVLGVDGRAHWEQRVDDRAFRFASVDVQLDLKFNDHHMEAARAAPAEQSEGRKDPVEHGKPKAQQSLPQPLPNATAEGHRSEDHESDRLLREALLQVGEASRRAEIAESRALRCEKLVQDAEIRAAAAERLVAELQAKLALSELQGARAELVQKVRADIDLAAPGEGHLQRIERKARAARGRRYAGYSPSADDAVLFCRNRTDSSAASSTCDASEFGWVASPPTPRSRQSTSQSSSPQ